ncbi:hypothetical protein JCM8547_007481 [Rhodosporidiobolus lusitaniae]
MAEQRPERTWYKPHRLSRVAKRPSLQQQQLRSKRLQLETVTTTTTVTAPQLQVEEYTTFNDEAETPLVYETSTISQQAAFPLVTDTSYAPTPTTTVTLHITTTLQQPVTTVTATSTVQSTRCGSRNAAYSQAFCPLPIPAVVKLDQIAQVNMLNLYTGLNGNRPITVDRGSAGVFSY